MKSHAAVAAELLNSRELVEGVIRDPETSGLSDQEKILFRFVRKVNEDSVNIGPKDIAVLHEAGYGDEAVYYALTVCALFNFYNRWIDASGVHAMSDEAHRIGTKRPPFTAIREVRSRRPHRAKSRVDRVVALGYCQSLVEALRPPEKLTTIGDRLLRRSARAVLRRRVRESHTPSLQSTGGIAVDCFPGCTRRISAGTPYIRSR